MSLSSDSLSSSSDSLNSSSDELKVEKIEVKLEPYPKLEGDGDEEHYQGLEYGIVFACHKMLYAKFQSMMTAFGEFVV